MARKPKRKSGTGRDAEDAPRKSAKQGLPDAAAGLTRKDVRGLNDAVVELRAQTAVLDELVRGLRKQVKRLKRAEPAKSKSDPKRKRAAAAGGIEDGPPRTSARAIGAARARRNADS